jgi:hypothetical protein
MFGTLGAVGALGRRGTKPFAYVLFPDGTLHQEELTDKRIATRAQADVLRFNAAAEAEGKAALSNALAASSQPAEGFAGGVTSDSAEGSAQDGTGIAAELERLVALHASGMLDDENFRAAKARIIHGG